MMQFAVLLNELRGGGTDCFAKFLNTASTSDAGRAGGWLSSATPGQVKDAATLLNEGKLDEFRVLIGIGTTHRSTSPATKAGTGVPKQKKPWWKFWG